MIKKFSQIKKVYEQEIQLSTYNNNVGNTSSNDQQNQNGVSVQTISDTDQQQNTIPAPVVTHTNTDQTITNTNPDPSKFFSKLVESREMAQVYHWQVKGDTGSHAAHLALNDYYDKVIDLIDEIVEVYQGQYDIVEEYDVIDTKETKTKDKVQYFIELSEFIKSTRYVALLKDDSHLQNIVDEIIALVYKTIYKLRFNK